MTPDTIGPNTQVTLHFAIHWKDQVIVSTFDKQPAVFTIGDGNLLPGFEKVLYGLSAGDQQHFTLPPEQAFGAHQPQYIHKLPRSRFDPELTLQSGLIINFEQSGTQFPGVVQSIADDMIEVDFNHGFAGKIIDFNVHILKLAVAPDQETS